MFVCLAAIVGFVSGNGVPSGAADGTCGDGRDECSNAQLEGLAQATLASSLLQKKSHVTENDVNLTEDNEGYGKVFAKLDENGNADEDEGSDHTDGKGGSLMQAKNSESAGYGEEGSLNMSAMRPNCGSEHFYGSRHRRRRVFSRRRQSSCDCGDDECCEPEQPSVCPDNAPVYEEGAHIEEAYVPCSCDCTAPEGYELFERTWTENPDACQAQDNIKYYVKFNFAQPFKVANEGLSADPCKCMCAKVDGQPEVNWVEPVGDTETKDQRLCVGQCGGGCPGGAWKTTCMAHDICVVSSKLHGHVAGGGTDSDYCGGTRFAAEIKAAVGCW